MLLLLLSSFIIWLHTCQAWPGVNMDLNLGLCTSTEEVRGFRRGGKRTVGGGGRNAPVGKDVSRL